ncbi:SagB family peptide dehydrogenase [Fictibacillus phosphorivorans]|uniref:SagB family peptide dehydrogenase n=1 Tax=Fictibacillus phosphorivorans TaxID=1221500 RepID=UPI002040F70D|nr:SagB family peptide dehydrogenase [Fictibacillus phosphorivorans]MCM3718157.1 SagB family peptide dehydrogenase [Fictibacillus phosphorivorans]MCM3775784.1 SagB family peptide dehydrogenase [Fictibacillus phosphorivorans]
MNLDEFLYKLHYETDQITPPDWEVNWEDAPLPYKLYQGLPFIELDSEISPELGRTEKPTLKSLSDFLSYSFGLTQVSESFPFPGDTGPWLTYRRFIPSGGGLYPNELYLYLKMDGVADGIYHYDAAHHRLVCLREGNFDHYLDQALGSRCDLSSVIGAIFISTFFWKNFFKYHNFSYRLQGLDAGFVIGQLLEVGKRLGFETGVYYQFLDRALHHLIGINEKEESVYAVIPLSMDKKMTWFDDREHKRISAEKLCKELPPLHPQHYVRSKEIIDYPMLLKMNEACMMDTFSADPNKNSFKKEEWSKSSISLSKAKRLSPDFYSACRKRYSPGLDFVLKPINENTLSSLLNETSAVRSYRNDVDKESKQLPSRLSIYVTTYQIEGLPHGVYVYDDGKHSLVPLAEGDYRTALQDGLLSAFVNTTQIPLSFTIAGDTGHLKDRFGYRGHRIQHMEAGILSHSLNLAASALNLGAHPILGFHVPWYDELFQLKKVGRTSLLHLSVGYYRSNGRLQGSLRF